MVNRGTKEEPGEKRLSITSWLKLKFLGSSKDASPVDTQFLTDLSDIKKIGRYEVLEKIGQGSMGVVFKGRDPYIKRDVSIKISRPAADVGSEKAERYRERFFVEAQSAGRLIHPNIVAIYDGGMYRDFCYMTMEYIDGPTLKKFCNKSNLLPIIDVAKIMFTVCKALDYAHSHGVIHRDIKPSNIMINKAGYVKIMDFGIAEIKSEQTASIGILGSPSYMSPEQIKENELDHQTDIFSLGCVFYELLAGVKAFSGENNFAIMYKIVRDKPTPISAIRSEIPEVLEKIVHKSLATDPMDRYQTCGDLAYDLRVAIRGIEGDAPVTDRVDDVVDYAQGVSFFEAFNREQVKDILNASNISKVRKGKVVVSEGDIDDSFYIILSGRTVVRKGDHDIAMIGRGECFGEMAYLSGQPRVATVVADTDCILMKISATLLDRASKDIRLLFLKNFALTLIQRLSESNKRL